MAHRSLLARSSHRRTSCRARRRRSTDRSRSRAPRRAASTIRPCTSPRRTELAPAVHARGRAHEARAAILDAAQRAPAAAALFALVERLPVEIGTPAPPLAAHARRSAERVDLEPRVVGDDVDGRRIARRNSAPSRAHSPRTSRTTRSRPRPATPRRPPRRDRARERPPRRTSGEARAACPRCASPAPRERTTLRAQRAPLAARRARTAP